MTPPSQLSGLKSFCLEDAMGDSLLEALSPLPPTPPIEIFSSDEEGIFSPPKPKGNFFSLSG
jgi:hypothetical protein